MAGEEYVSYSDYLMLQRERDEAIARSKEWSDWCVEYKSELEEAQKDTKILSRRMKTLWDSSEKVCRERDELLKECMQMSIEFGLPPTIRPADGEIRRMINGWKQAIVERDEAREILRKLLDALSKLVALNAKMTSGECTYERAYYCYYKGHYDTWKLATEAIAKAKEGAK
jgi:hypothetical protein